MKIESLSKSQLWDLRKQVSIGDSYKNSYNISKDILYTFFNGYFDYLWELASEDGNNNVMEFDCPDILYSWFNSFVKKC